MKKKIIVICALGIGIALLSGNSTKLLVQSSEINENISPEMPEEEKSYYVANKEQLFQEKEKKKAYEADLQVYVEGKVLQYESVLRNITQVNEEIKLLEEKIQANRELHENGKITEIKVIEMETEQKRLIYEQKSLMYDAQCIRYILEHKIEGVEI